MKVLFLSFVVFVFSGCAATYEAPILQSADVRATTNMSKTDALMKAKRVLLSEGYQIQSYDDLAGFVSTAHRNVKLSQSEASCGTTMGIDYLKDARTKTTVALNVMINESDLSVKAIINGEYKPGDVSQDMTLTCVSTGAIERHIARLIEE